MLSPDLMGFLAAAVHSVWTVELLLVLRREPGATWSAPDLVRELRGSAALVDEGLRTLHAGGVVQEIETGLFAYAPASPILETICSELEQEFKLRPGEVIRAIVTRSNNKVQGLADAFRFKETE